jgi:Predicted oxidoreductases (related to aryl-alcohol dehydrogenases)
VVLSTKVGYDFYHFEKPTRRFDPDYLGWAAAKSAERLGRRPDILMIHNPTADAVRKTAPWLKAQRGTLARCVGAALGPETYVLEEGLAALEAGLDVMMFVFNILEQDPAGSSSGAAEAGYWSGCPTPPAYSPTGLTQTQQITAPCGPGSGC